MSLPGRLGASVDLDRVPALSPDGNMPDLLTLLYSESASRLLVTVPPDKAAGFDDLLRRFQEEDAACLGRVGHGPRLLLARDNAVVCSADAEELARAFKATFDW
jgi:phosphoribosylformylglycinamidine synthase